MKIRMAPLSEVGDYHLNQTTTKPVKSVKDQASLYLTLGTDRRPYIWIHMRQWGSQRI